MSIIIQCTKCSTKFSIAEKAVESIADPKFHCSRCGHYFVMSESAAKSSTTTVTAKEEKKPEQLGLIEDRLEDEDPFEGFEDEAEIIGNLTNFGVQKEEEEDSDIDEIMFDDFTDDLPNDSIEEEVFESSFEKNVVDFPTPEPEAIKQKEPEASTIPKATWLTVSLISSIPAVLCYVFFLLGQNINHAPPVITWFLSRHEVVSSPPPGIELLNLKSELINKEDQSKTIKISGDIFNATRTSYKEIRVQAGIYDKENKLLKNQLVNLQKNTQPETDYLEPNERQGFKLLLSINEKEPAIWFSAKVYSVQPVS